MDDTQLLRYSRHILLDDLGLEGQERLLKTRVLMIGAGGLGSSAGLFLGSAGVGHLTVVDHDVVDATNLQRQIAHNLARIGQTQSRVDARSHCGHQPPTWWCTPSRNGLTMPCWQNW
jgi:molybdopterin/thiamine biosynthesis adenylyltransferase